MFAQPEFFGKQKSGLTAFPVVSQQISVYRPQQSVSTRPSALQAGNWFEINVGRGILVAGQAEKNKLVVGPVHMENVGVYEIVWDSRSTP